MHNGHIMGLKTLNALFQNIKFNHVIMFIRVKLIDLRQTSAKIKVWLTKIEKLDIFTKFFNILAFLQVRMKLKDAICQCW